MKRKLLTAGLAVILSAGITLPAWSVPDGPQRLRGMDGRVFFVQVELLENIINLPEDLAFPNCYFFNEGGEWLDPGFLNEEGNIIPGSWSQHTPGAATTYTADVFNAENGLALRQEGSVTPARGRGVLQLEATSTLFVMVDLDGNGQDDQLDLAVFKSVGSEVESCPL